MRKDIFMLKVIIFCICIFMVKYSLGEEEIKLPIDSKSWSTRGGKEGKVYIENQTVIWHLKLDYKGGHAIYKYGWPLLAHKFDPPINLETYSFLKFLLKVETKYSLPSIPIKVGLRKDIKKEPPWQSIEIKRNEWKTIEIPLFKFPDLKETVEIIFYIAEKWYERAGFPDGSEIKFFLKDISFVKVVTAKIEAFYLSKYTYTKNDNIVTVFLEISGDIDNIRILFEKDGKKVKEKIYPFKKVINLNIGGFEKGIYKLQIESLDDPSVSNYTYLRIEEGLFPYLMCIAFSSRKFWGLQKQIDTSWLRIINEIPYNGVAAQILGGYETSPVPDLEALNPIIELIKRKCKKDIWPWIFFNRFVGRYKQEQEIKMLLSTQKISDNQFSYFSKIKGIDIYDKAGALSDFYKLYRLALKIAKKLNSPGIIIDPELYNNRRVYDIRYLAEEQGKSKDEVIRQLKSIGHKLAKITEEEYPSAILWFLFLEPGKSVSYIGQGIVEAAENGGINLRVVEGGETTLKYINTTLEQLHLRMKQRGIMYSKWIQNYSHTFYLGGTIAPCDTPETRRKGQWIDIGYAGSTINSIKDLYPFFRDIFSTYKYVWIYAAGAANFFPFDERGEKFNTVIGRALKDVAGYKIDFSKKGKFRK